MFPLPLFKIPAERRIARFCHLVEAYLDYRSHYYYKIADSQNDLFNLLSLFTKKQMEKPIRCNSKRKSYINVGDSMVHVLVKYLKTPGIMQIFLDKFINLNLQTVGKRKTLLHYSVEKGNYEMLQLLLYHGADPNICDDFGKTPLYWAFESKRFTAVTILFPFSNFEQHDDIAGKNLLHIIQKRGDINLIFLVFLAKLDHHQGTSFVHDSHLKKLR